MSKIIIITREQLELMTEMVAGTQVLNEYFGIDVNYKTVSYNPNHQNRLYTNDINNPNLVDLTNNSKSKKYKIYSIFQKQSSNSQNDKSDGNPLAYALKNKNDYKFSSEKDKEAIYEIINVVCSTLKGRFDTIVVCPSSNNLNYDFANILSKASGCKNVITDMFVKLNSKDVFKSEILPKKEELNNEYYNDNMSVYRALEISFARMSELNNGIFSYKYFLSKQLRKYVNKTMKFINSMNNKYANLINNKRIVILDDVISSGKTLSETSKNILDSYNPSDVIFLALIGSYPDADINL